MYVRIALVCMLGNKYLEENIAEIKVKYQPASHCCRVYFLNGSSKSGYTAACAS
jgi:hypothetical protein